MKKIFYFSVLILTLFLGIILSSLSSANISYAESEGLLTNMKVVTLGDSIVFGYDPNNPTVPLENNFSKLLNDRMNTTLSNLGLSGDNTQDLLNNLQGTGEFSQQNIDFIKTSDIIVMCIGANDVLGPAFNYIENYEGLMPNVEDLKDDINNSLGDNCTHFKNRYSAILDWFKTNNSSAQIYLLNIYNPYTKTSPIFSIDLATITEEYVNQINTTISNLIEDDSYINLDLNYVDIYTAFSNEFTNNSQIVYAVNGQISNFDKDIDPHPTELGHELIENLLWNTLEPNISAPEISSEDISNVLVYNFSKLNVSSNVLEGSTLTWYENGVASNFLTSSNLTNYSPSESGEFKVKLKLNGKFSNELVFNLYDVTVTANTSMPDELNNNTCDITFTYSFNTSVPELRKEQIKLVIQKSLFNIFETHQSTYVVVNNGIKDLYALEKVSDDLVKYTPLVSGSHTVEFVKNLVTVTMPSIQVAPVGYIEAEETEYILGEFEEIVLKFEFSSVVQEKQWLWKLPNRSTMEFLPAINNNLSNTYTIQVDTPGVYHFAVQYKYNNVSYTSNILKLRVSPSEMESDFEPVITHIERQSTKNNIKAFEFKVTNVKNIDPKSISWRINGIQKGTGYSFLLEPDFVDAYVVYAVINGQDSNHITVNAVINNTLEKILIIVGVVAFLSIILAIEIIVKIKKEKIW